VGLSLKAAYLKRYKDIALMLLKYSRSDLVKSAGLEDVLDDDPRAAPSKNGESPGSELAADLELLGPTFIKLGQLLSTRPDILPPAYIQGLSKLQDRIEPFAFAEVDIVQNELGIRISKAFAHFEAKPVGSASLGQVHRAKLRDGRVVAVKVQRPGVKARFWKTWRSSPRWRNCWRSIMSRSGGMA
jgi:ubiquinone biosynthesis protein